MHHIVIVSSSVRTGRKSHRVALFLQKYIERTGKATAEIADLNFYRFPLFDERLKYQKNPLPGAVEFSQKIKSADGVIIVTPEYNGGPPASIINVIDLLTDEWRRKPVAISTVSDGQFGGSQVIISLQFILWKIKAFTVPAMFPVPRVDEVFDENGNPYDPDSTEKRASIFIDEIMQCIKAKETMS
ncbi:MAG: NAD(P)H-dependent oxidoreductase [Bacteroidales bacterium]|nr:NAD(P)H-dependent oxidoreductase [Bacteroidales bacterium]